MIERKIIIGLVCSTEYLTRVRPFWNSRFLESKSARMLANWCLEYFDKYSKAPFRHIEDVFFEKLKRGKLTKNVAKELEEEILPSLSEEYEEESVNVDYLVDKTKKFFNERNLKIFCDQIESAISAGNILGAEKIANTYIPIIKETGEWIDMAEESVDKELEKAFTTDVTPLMKFPGALGQFWNDQLLRGKFITLLAPEKRGKSFWLLEFAMRGCKQGLKVAFFQAGDMTASEQLIRMSIYLTRKSNKEKYCKKMYEPVLDCIHNQTDECDKEEREGDSCLFTSTTTRNDVSMDQLIGLFKQNKKHEICTNCKEFKNSKWGTVWLREVEKQEPLTLKEAQTAFDQFFRKYKRKFKLSTYINGTLTINDIKATLDIWEDQENFMPDLILIDYADLLEHPTNEFRHKQNEIWKGMRGISQERYALVITGTQADADSYSRGLLTMGNFSEDKRKHAHITAEYGLNQDAKGNEKELGIMRLNKVAIREGDFTTINQVYVLQNLKRGRPFLTSFW